jgi:hypothetical protein
MRYLKDFSPHTIKGCWRVFNRWLRLIGQMPSEDNLYKFGIDMREANLNVTTCNISIITFNSFLTWMKEMVHSTIRMTMHYVGEVEIEDLKMMHQKTSILGQLK